MSSYNAINETWGFCVLPSQPIKKKTLKDILEEERKEQNNKKCPRTLPTPVPVRPPERKQAEGKIPSQTTSDELLAFMLQLEEEEKLKNSMVSKREQEQEMQKYKNNTIGVSELVLTNTRDEGEDNVLKLLPKGWDNPWKRHDREVSGKLNSLRLGCYDGMGDLPHDRVINNQVFNKVKDKLVKLGAIKTTDNYLL